MICFVLQFDSGIQRFMSMRATEYDHFRATPKTSLYGLCVIVIPMLAFGYWVKTTRVRYSHFQLLKINYQVDCYRPCILFFYCALHSSYPIALLSAGVKDEHFFSFHESLRHILMSCKEGFLTAL